MILKITSEEASRAIKYYYKEVKGFDIGKVALVKSGFKDIHFELEMAEDQIGKDLPIHELKSVHEKLEAESESVKKKKGK